MGAWMYSTDFVVSYKATNWLFWFVWFVLFILLNQINQTNQTNQRC